MGTPAVFANSFSFTSNYLLNPKTGEKRTFFNTLHKSQVVADPVPYIVDFLPKLVDTTEERSFAPYLSRYGTRMPFQVPQIKMPSLVGGFVGSKSQSTREDCKKLGDILANAFSQVVNNKTEDSEKISSGEDFNIENNTCSRNLEKSVCASPNDLTMNESQALQFVAPLRVQNKSSSSDECRPTANLTKKHCKNLTPKENKDKPPVKKPKLNLQTSCSSPKRKHKRRRKSCERKTQHNSPVVLPGYDPGQSSFESVDEGDSGIVLYNRFAALDNMPNHMLSESTGDLESSDSPLLDMLSEMHIDDFEVKIESASPAVQLKIESATPTVELKFESSPSVDTYDVHSYETDSPLTCNSTIAFILSGNDDVLGSDSEDGSYGSDFDDFQWQSFKADFEYFQEHIPMSNIVVGACEISELHIDADLGLFEDDIFLNDLECQSVSDTEKRLREVNMRWNQIVVNQSERQNPTKVCFAPDSTMTSIFYIPSGPEECEARKGPWDQCYMDRCRFEKRIKELEPIISHCLTPQHRKSVFQRIYGSDEQSE